MWQAVVSLVASRVAVAGLAIGVTATLSLQPAPRLEAPLPQKTVITEPLIVTDPSTGTQTTTVDVLIYNVAALPWPLRGNRTKALHMIGDELAFARERGEAPDIILIQEGFRRSMSDLIDRAGYPNWVRGPARTDLMPEYSDVAPETFQAERRWDKAEGLGKVAGSGLYVLSDWPILRKEISPFYASECAGYDCAANKGMLWVEIEVPGMPGHLQMFNTHLNARRSTGVPEARSLTAYSLQTARMADVVSNHYDGEEPLIFGGDFNAKGSAERFDAIMASGALPGALVHKACAAPRSDDCGLTVTGETSSPWLETQDWQGWRSGANVTVRPISKEVWFADEIDGAPEIKGRRTLSDHDAVLVRYELSWTPQETDTLVAALDPAASDPR